jgi:class 3 adenylate cyclase
VYQAACSGVMPTYDGFIAKFMGDSVLAYFGYPRAHEDDPGRAVRAGLDIKFTSGSPRGSWWLATSSEKVHPKSKL